MWYPARQPIQCLVPGSLFSPAAGIWTCRSVKITAILHLLVQSCVIIPFPPNADQHTLDPLTNWDEMCSQLSNYPADSIISCVERHTIRPCSLPSSCYRLPSPFGMCFQLSHRHTCIWPSLMNALLTDAKVPACSLGSAQYLLAAKWC